MQYIRPPSTTTQFDPVGAIGRGYQTGANIMADIDTTRERKRQEQARNYFGPAVGGDTQSLTKLAQSSPQLAKMAVDVKTYIDQTDNPEELKLTANQMKTMAGAVKAGMAAPDQWPKVQNILAQALNKSPEEIGGVDQAGFYYNMLVGGAGEASKKLEAFAQIPGTPPGTVGQFQPSTGEYKNIQKPPAGEERDRLVITKPDAEGNVAVVNTDLAASGKGNGVVARFNIQGEQPKGDPLFNRVVVPEAKSRLETAAEEGTGPIAKVQRGWNNVIGPWTRGIPFPDAAKGQNELRRFNQYVKQALTINPRNPVAELTTIQGFLPDPDRFLTDPDTEKSKVRELEEFLILKKQSNNKQMSAGTTMKRKGMLIEQNSAIDGVLDVMNEGRDNPFLQMGKEELFSIDPNTLGTEEEVDQYMEAIQ